MIKALLLLLFSAAPVLAESQNDILQARVLPGWQMQNGHFMAGLELQLAPKWKTYWRAPGDAGIPPQFNWSGSSNLRSVVVHWPSPSVFHTNGMQSIGYHDHVILPIEVVAIDPTKPVDLRAEIDLGVCKDICMPAALQMTAQLTVPGQPDDAIRVAMKSLPMDARQGGLRSIGCEVTPIADGLRLTATMALPKLGADEVVAFETDDLAVWISEAIVTRDGNTLIAQTDLVTGSGAPFALDRSGVTLTVLGAGRAVEVKGCPAP